MNNFEEHKKSDKLKWALTGVTLILILALLAGIIAVLVTNTNVADLIEQAMTSEDGNADQTEDMIEDPAADQGEEQTEEQSDETVNEGV